MAIISGLLDKIRSKKRQLELSRADQYLQTIRDMASGKELDADEVAEILDALSKTERDFELDVEKMEQRFVEAGQLKEKEALERTIPTLTRNLELASEALEAAYRKLQPSVEFASQQLRSAENRQLLFHGIEGKLVSSCMDQSLLTREKELISQRAELHSKRTPLQSDLRTAQAIIRNCEISFESLKHQSKKNPNYKPEQSDIRSKERSCADELARQKPYAEQLEAAIAKIDEELEPINRELADINKQKLVP